MNTQRKLFLFREARFERTNRREPIEPAKRTSASAKTLKIDLFLAFRNGEKTSSFRRVLGRSGGVSQFLRSTRQGCGQFVRLCWIERGTESANHVI